MARPEPKHIVIVGAGAAGLMTARELARAGKRVTILEARDKCGGRIQSLSVGDAVRGAEGGAEFVHGEAPVTLGLLREARLSILPIEGTAWTVAEGRFSTRAQDPHMPEFHKALQRLEEDLPIAEFLRRHFAGSEYGGLRRSIGRMVESYDAADPERASTLALRDEWLHGGRSTTARIAGGYGALADFLVASCRDYGGTIRLGAVAKAIENGPGGGALVRCANGDVHAGDVVILTVPLPLLRKIELPEAVREKVKAAVGGIGFGNVIKILLGFRTRWWTHRGPGLGDLTFLLSDRKIPVWWTQFPDETALLTGWFGGPKTEGLACLDEDQLIDAGLGSLADIFQIPAGHLKRNLVVARAINWGIDPFAGGAYSYVTPQTREALAGLASPNGGSIYFCGEALYRGKDMGTVEAALTSGLETARSILGVRPM
jgi:monoamine oxidase